MAEVTIRGGSGGSANLRGYLAEPVGDGPWPGVVAIHEALGLNALVRRQADRLAGAGYLALAPDLFSDGGVARCLVSTFRDMFRGSGKAVVDIEATRQHLLADERCTGKVGVIGFCMGGGFALVTANTGFDVAAPNYGPLPKDLRRALAGTCPMVASYGGSDISLRGAAGKLADTLDDLGVEHDVKEYPGAGHSFLNDEYFGPSVLHAVQRIAKLGPEPLAAADAWQRIETFFAEHLGADEPAG
jgi:carboxymethylenebutenolidase